MRNCMTRSITTVEAGTPHAALGLPTYVQFTSPIRRYTDLLAHYQVRPAPASVRTCPRMHALRSLPRQLCRSSIARSRQCQSSWVSQAVQPI